MFLKFLQLILLCNMIFSKQFIFKGTRITLPEHQILCELKKCNDAIKCIGIYSIKKLFFSTIFFVQIETFNDDLFSRTSDVFIDSAYDFVYSTLKNSKSYRTKQDGYFTFAELKFVVTKTFDEYADGFYYDSKNYYLGNEFLHQLSMLHTINFKAEVFVFGLRATAEHRECYFKSKSKSYEAFLGPVVSTNMVMNDDHKKCVLGSSPAHGNKFEVNGRHAFWGRCYIPYKQGVPFLRPMAENLIITIKYNFPH
ncbi:hypothetical protein SNEBB_001623 [Seison nebaliae]|nr:hypothetical protein SNEBB_001623 [Seison nebaliae]